MSFLESVAVSILNLFELLTAFNTSNQSLLLTRSIMPAHLIPLQKIVITIAESLNSLLHLLLHVHKSG